MKHAAAARVPAWVTVFFAALLVGGGTMGQEVVYVNAGDIVFEADFEGADPLEGWDWTWLAGIDTGYDSPQSLFFDIPAGSPGSKAVQRPIPLDGIRGAVIEISAKVKAENVTEKPNPWNGVKLMAVIEAGGETFYPQARIDTGSFGWRDASFGIAIPENAGSVRLHLGLEEVSGKAWFDDLKIRIVVPPPRPAAPPGGPQVEDPRPAYRGHDLPRLRGAMVSPSITRESVRTLGEEWNANLVRWQFVNWDRFREGEPFDHHAYDAWLDGEIARLDAALPWFEQHGLLVVVDLHTFPNLFENTANQEKFVEVWERLARRYRDAKAIWAYDLLNEPDDREAAPGVLKWRELAERTAKAVRAIDPDTAIIVEPSPGGLPDAFRQFVPIDAPGIVYSAHMYVPHAFTHQGVSAEWPDAYEYPGPIQGRMWDKERLRTALQPVREFQARHNVHIYIGEFSAVRWAPNESAHRYLRDVIELFEEYGWDWSYHAFREFHGWSVEHGPDRFDTRPVPGGTLRQALLLDWFSQNEKPSFD